MFQSYFESTIYLKIRFPPFEQVALKRQQATEDAIALGLRSVASGTRLSFLPPGPIFGGNETIGDESSPELQQQQQQQLLDNSDDDDDMNEGNEDVGETIMAMESSARSCGESPPSPEIISNDEFF